MTEKSTAEIGLAMAAGGKITPIEEPDKDYPASVIQPELKNYPADVKYKPKFDFEVRANSSNNSIGLMFSRATKHQGIVLYSRQELEFVRHMIDKYLKDGRSENE